MLSSHVHLARTFLLSLIALLCLPVTDATGANFRAQGQTQQTNAPSAATPSDTARGIELYQATNYQAAIEVLRRATKQRPKDAQAWLHLGIALSRAGETKDARKAFEKAIKLRPEMPEPHIGMALVYFATGKPRESEAEAARALALDPRNAESHYAIALLRLNQNTPSKALEDVETALRINPNFGPALTLKAHVLTQLYAAEEAAAVAPQPSSSSEPRESVPPEQRAKMVKWLQEAVESLDSYLKRFPASPDAARVREQARTLRLHADSVSKSDEPLVYKAADVTTKARITSKPLPSYTERARNKGITGVVRLRLLLSFDGQVRNISVINWLPEGLSEMAILAARGIKFTPAKKDGRPVSQYVTIEYNFNVY